MRRLRWAGLWLLGSLGCSDRIGVDLQRASDLLLQERYRQAEGLFSDCLARLGQRPQTAERRAQTRLALGRLGTLHSLYLRDYGRAVADFESLARRFAGEDAGRAALQSLGELYAHKLLDWPAAIGAWQRLAAEYSQDPAAPQALLQVVGAHLKLQAPAAAREAAARLRRLYPDSPQALAGRVDAAFSLLLEGQLAQALQAFEALPTAQLTPVQRALVDEQRAECHLRLGAPERGLGCLLAALAAHPEPSLVQTRIAQVHQDLGRLRRGVRVAHHPGGGAARPWRRPP